MGLREPVLIALALVSAIVIAISTPAGAGPDGESRDWMDDPPSPVGEGHERSPPPESIERLGVQGHPLPAEPGTILHLEGDLRLQGTADSPVQIHAPVVVDGSPSTHLVVQHGVFAPSVPADCALAVRGGSIRIENSTFTGARNGLCLRPSTVDQAAWGERGSFDLLDPIHPSGGKEYVAIDGLSNHRPPGQQPTEPKSPAATVLVWNRYVDNDRAGLNLSKPPQATGEWLPLVSSRSETFEQNGQGVRVEDVGRLALQDAMIRDNEIGLLHRGGEVTLEHSTLRSNDLWDVYSTQSPAGVQWTGTRIDPSCVHFEGRATQGCQRAAVGVSPAMLVFAILSSIVFLFSEAGRFFLTRGVGLRLYNRIPREELLEHEARKQLFDRIKTRPGACIAQLARDTGLPRGTACYHLARLEDGGLVDSEREGVYRRFYPVGEERDSGPQSTRDHVLAEIVRSPGIHGSEIARELEISRQLVSYHVTRLDELGRIERRENKQTTHLFPADERSEPRPPS